MENYSLELDNILESDYTKRTDAIDYTVLVDEHPSTIIDKNSRTLSLESTETLIQGDANSSAKSFIIERYYDGVDLSDKTIEIIYERPDGEGDIVAASDIEYTDEALRFTWVMGAHALAKTGTLTFCIQFTGIDEFGHAYCYKTANGQFNLSSALTGDAVVATNDSWTLAIEARLANLESGTGGSSGGSGGGTSYTLPTASTTVLGGVKNRWHYHHY